MANTYPIKNKTMTHETIITMLIGLVLTAYGFIFNSFQTKIKKLEDRPNCTPDNCVKRFDDIERTQKDMNPIWTEIRERLASIETALLYITGERPTHKDNN